MGEIEDGLERALHTRPLPQSTAARLRFLLRREKGSTRALALRLGVSQRAVQHWLKGDRHPRPEAAARIEEQVRADWQPRVRRRIRRQAEAGGMVIHTRARFGFTAAPGSTDDPRLRMITQHVPAETAAALFAARDAGASEDHQARILAQGLAHAYFRDGGRRATGLEVEFTGIDFVDFGI
ncbi:telomere-protecting terminal protein Tpg [Streptacidiphilus sp. ASG 303]|uniref:telomere-protecting terminal protein Tpg n=1 Tax=Streptomycetaceae TaxID=2062 RepID=UPI001E2FDBCB|nr:helix-turn-helix transcriptional regulator [Streptacidiphilus sp. ASG 303]MCD0483595.1 helix-turn-helix domain-containing protein [Streptacidiphilus sp. ASG 303]